MPWFAPLFLRSRFLRALLLMPSSSAPIGVRQFGAYRGIPPAPAVGYSPSGRGRRVTVTFEMLIAVMIRERRLGGATGVEQERRIKARTDCSILTR